MMTHLEQIRMKARKGDAASFSWLHAAAEKGEVWAQVAVAEMFKDGKGTTKDVGAAIRFLQMAVAKDDPEGMTLLGIMLRDGIGTERDEQQAAQLFRRAAHKNNPAAQCHLGLMYARGMGLNQDTQQARFWLREASKAGSILADIALQDLCGGEDAHDPLKSASSEKPRLVYAVIQVDPKEWRLGSPLTAMGYHVGKTRKIPAPIRRNILETIYKGTISCSSGSADIDIANWGQPETEIRLLRMVEHLCRNIARRETLLHLHDDAADEWRDDAAWLKRRFYDGHFHFHWPLDE